MAKERINKPIPEDIGEYLEYDKATGNLLWINKTANSTVEIGTIAGTKDNGRYTNVGFKNNVYKAHRVIWFLQNGTQPSNEIDHVNGGITTNIEDNLRAATRSQQCMNRGKFKNNTSGFKGVGLHKGKWRARIQIQNAQKHLGYFDTPEEAHAAYCETAKELHGDFSNYG